MSNEYVTVRNLLTKRVGKVRRRIAEKSPVLEIVPDGTKNFVPIDDLVSGSGPDIESYVGDDESEEDFDQEDEEA